MKVPPEIEPLRITVTDLIDQGLINAPTTVFGIHSGRRISARLTAEGRFVHRRSTYSSPSGAAGKVITAELGATSAGRPYLPINGWKFWQVVCADGKTRTLAEVREQLLSC
jgi:hypothetical protein